MKARPASRQSEKASIALIPAINAEIAEIQMTMQEISGPGVFVVRQRSFRLLSTCFLLLLFSASVSKAQHKPQGAFANGHYRDLFLEGGHPHRETSAKLDKAFQQLFHGEAKTEALYFEAGRNAQGPLAYLTDWGNQDVRTEGMSYGMIIAVQMDHKTEFDALWNWTMTYLYIASPKHPAYGYYSWSAKTSGEALEETPAPDGEEYFVMALYFASARWGDGVGIYDYHAQADRLLRAMLHRQRIVGQTNLGERDIYAEVDAAHGMIRYVPGKGGREFTDPSYHLPAFYELWARWGPTEDRTFWTRAARISRTFLAQAVNPKTGLTPVYANFDGTPHTTGFSESTQFGHDAWRTASNWSVDWSWFHAAPQEPVWSDTVQAFFAAQGPAYGDIYTLDGKQVGANHSAGLVAVNAVASLAATDTARAKLFTEALWALDVPRGQGRYYDGMLYLLSMLHVSGEFRIWTPAWAGHRR